MTKVCLHNEKNIKNIKNKKTLWKLCDIVYNRSNARMAVAAQPLILQEKRNSSDGSSSWPKKIGGEASDVHPMWKLAWKPAYKRAWRGLPRQFSRRLNCYAKMGFPTEAAWQMGTLCSGTSRPGCLQQGGNKLYVFNDVKWYWNWLGNRQYPGVHQG